MHIIFIVYFTVLIVAVNWEILHTESSFMLCIMTIITLYQ